MPHRARSGWDHVQKRGLFSDYLPLTTLLPHASSSSSVSSSSSSISTTSSTPTPTPTPTPAPQPSVFETTSNGQVHTITTFVDAAPASTSSAAPTPAPPTAFLQNKALSGTVFALIGLLALVAVLALATFAIRRKRNNKLLREAISFDPGAGGDYYDEKERRSLGLGSPRSSGDHHGQYPSPPVNGGAAAYPFGQGYGYGHHVNAPQQPGRALVPHARGAPSPDMLPNPAHGEWAPNMAPYMQTPANAPAPADDVHQVLRVAN
ncbi:hypothetical protein DXG01_007956 [Tephrocybe rancida]|nr:hypothetical protein DXG01_007956 [Tephrocybe rancida]